MKGKVISMKEIREIIHRLRMGHSKRQIQKELGVYRPIIRKLYDLAITYEWLNNQLPMPSDEEVMKLWNQKSKTETQFHPLNAHKGQIEQWNKEGLTSIVIHQLLKDQCPCDVQAIRRFRKKHFPKPIEPVMVRTTVPGRDLELDFGELGRFRDDDGVVKRVWLFSLRLRHSRKAYREIVTDQTLQTFLMGHVHAFEYLGGVPKNCIMDNLKAAVIRSTIDNDMINRSYQGLAEHYGFVISPCLPRTPEHKGGVEGDVKYSKINFLPYFLAKQKQIGIQVSKISDLREALEKWDKEVANIHIIHGVGRSPAELFNSEEANTLQPLPNNRWEPTSWNQCTVRKDWRIIINNAYYSVPYLLVGEVVEVCMTDLFVRIFHKHKEIALHEKATKKWEYRRKTEHAPPYHEAVLQCTREGLLEIAAGIGKFTCQLAQGILSNPAVDKLKPVRSLLNLVKKFSKERLERACERAFTCKLFSYASVKNILQNNLEAQPLELGNASKVIPFPNPRFARDPADYKSTYKKAETFEEKLEKMHPTSKHGNAMMGAYDGLLADELMEEENKLGEDSDQQKKI